MNNTIALIYAGGEGSRLWPVSSAAFPKQINQELSKKTYLLETYSRVRKMFDKKNVLVVTNRNLYAKVKEIMDLPKENFLVEPQHADTAAAMVLTALYIETYFPDAVAVTYYTDQYIEDKDHFFKSVRESTELVRKIKTILVIATRPTNPNTQLGYIKLGKRLIIGKELFAIDKFLEKPNINQARQLIAHHSYVWNTGMYVWHAGDLLNAVKEANKKLYSQMLQLKIDIGSTDFPKKLEDWYASVEKTSFEKAISVKTKEMAVYVANFHWKDIGNWEAVYEISPKDKDGIASIGTYKADITSYQSKNCLVHPHQKRILLVGVDDLIVAQSKDELLICNRKKVDLLKEALIKLKKES